MNRVVIGAALCVSVVLPAQQPGVERYTFALELPATGKLIRGVALANLGTPPAVDTVVFDLDAAMHVRAVAFGCGGRELEAKFERTTQQLRVAIPRRRDPNRRGVAGTECIRTYYDGAPADGLIIGSDSAGRWTAFGDNFPNRARFWLPTMDHPSQKAKVTFIVTAPEGRTVVANGTQAERVTREDRRVTTTWREDRPIPTYAMVIAAGPLVLHDLGATACGFAEDGRCVPQMVWTAPEQARHLPGHFARAGDIVDFFAHTVGAFPYEKLGHLQTTTRYGGMENSSAIFYADALFRRANGVSDGLIAHETAHQWFGDAVTEREWAHAWLSEGFATFLAALWTQHARGDTAYRAEMARIRGEVLGAKIVTQRAVIDSVETDPNRLLNENTYQKGGFVLHMLRSQLGDSVFFDGIRRYLAEHRHGTAMTQDLQRALERSSGSALGWFFDQWLRKPGWAEVRTSWSWDAGTGRVRLLVEQDGRFGSYRLSLPVVVTDAAGVRRVETLEVSARASQVVELSGSFAVPPASVACDPDRTLLAVCTAK